MAKEKAKDKTNDKPLTEPRELRAMDLDRQVYGVRFSPSGRFLVAGGYDAQVRRWNWEGEEPQELAALKGHRGWVTALVFAPKEPLLITADSWGGLSAWPFEEENPKPHWQNEKAHDGWVRSVAISTDGTKLLTGGKDGQARLWSVADGKPLLELDHAEDVFAVAIHPDGQTAVTGDLFGKIKQWDLKTGKPTREIDASTLHYYQRDQDVAGIRVLEFHDDGQTLLVAGSEPTSTGRGLGIPTIRLFDWNTAKPKEALHQGESNDGFIFDLTRHPQGFFMTVTSGQPGRGQFAFHRLGEEKPFWIYKKMSNCHSIALHPSGKHVVVSATNRSSQGNGAVRDKEGKYLGNYSPLHIFELPETFA